MMHYYKRNLGDYAKKAGRLTMLQHGSYTLLIDSCYDREIFPTLEQALEWTWASTEAEVEAVKFVLNRFFTLDKDGCYVQDRILEELLQYHKNADINKRIADEREAKRKANNTNRERSVNEAPPNHKPLTTNQEPLTKVEKKHRGTRLPTELEIPDDYIAFCQQERQDLNPHSVWAQFKDYWIAQPGQKGVKADWQATWRNWVRSQKAEKSQESFFERDQKLKRERMKEFTPHVAGLKKIDPNTGFFIEEVTDVYAITSR
jgi:uncharacterized protein YdaU (DUF1376 family)